MSTNRDGPTASGADASSPAASGRRRWLKACGLVLVLLLLGGAGLVAALEAYSSRPSFCGSCHNMKPYHASWQADVHASKGIGCVDCHYAPGEKHTVHAKLRGLSQAVSYVAGAFGQGRPRGHVASESCTTADCHPSGELSAKSLLFPAPPAGAEAAAPVHHLKPFVHENHLKPMVTGHDLECASCHERRPGKAHMAVYSETCFQCHFTKARFNDGLGRCLLCHDLPEKPIRQSEDNPLTHQMLADRQVPCASCHATVVQGEGEVFLERCQACHDKPGTLAAWEYVKPHQHATAAETEACEACQQALRSKLLMHAAHVNTQHANCVDCHLEVVHRAVVDVLGVGQEDCRFCHVEAHEATVSLLLGKAGPDDDDEAAEPHAMNASHTTCAGCHIDQAVTKGHKSVLGAGQKACAACHGDQHQVLSEWQRLVDSGLAEAEDLRREAGEALQAADLPAATSTHWQAQLARADERLIYLRKAGATHNQKTAATVLDEVMTTCEDLLDALHANQPAP